MYKRLKSAAYSYPYTQCHIVMDSGVMVAAELVNSQAVDGCKPHQYVHIILACIETNDFRGGCQSIHHWLNLNVRTNPILYILTTDPVHKVCSQSMNPLEKMLDRCHRLITYQHKIDVIV